MPAARNWRSTRRLKSGESIPMTTSGRRAWKPRTSCLRIRSSSGRCRITSARPITDRRSIGTQLSTPAAIMAGPPMPWNVASGYRRRISCTSPAPSRSPEASPAMMPTRRPPRRESRECSLLAGIAPPRLAHDAARGVPDGGREDVQFGLVRGELLDLGERLGQLQPAAIKQLVAVADVRDLRGTEAASLQALGVDAVRARRGAADHDVGRHILADAGVLAEKRMRAGAAELVQAGEAAEDRPVVHPGMAGQADIIGKDDVIRDHAVMRNMRVGHDPVVVADARDALVLHGATI